MLEPRPISQPTNHEELFLQRYQWLMKWALRLTSHNKEQAQDLVHDTFVQFVISHPPLEPIQQNIDGYLYTMLRNMHVSQVRRAARIREATASLSRILTLSENSSLHDELMRAEHGTRAQVQDEVCRICQYAILRKDSSKVGSVMLLRFFHGYYPTEIARVLRASRSSVDKLLLRARSEAASYLKDPGSLNFISQRKKGAVPQIRFGQPPDDLLRELREAIHRARDGECLSASELHSLYRSDENDKLDQRLLSHLVSCPHCLDDVNRNLGLPLLNARHAATMTGKDSRKRDKGDGGDNGGAGSGASGDDLRSQSRERLEDVINHRPQELRVSVNGFILGSHAVNSELNKLSITAKGDEKIGFVEVFSEHEVRLLFSVVEPPPEGPVELIRSAELSDGRTLELSVDFSESWPAVQVVYNDPAFHSVTSTSKSRVNQLQAQVDAHSERPEGAPWRRWFDLRQWIPGRGLLFRPGTVTAVFALVLVAALLLAILRPTSITTVSATDLINRSIAAEQTQAAKTDQVLHQTLNLEERSATGAIVARRRIEIWRSAERGLTARRLYDERGSLIAGDWVRSDGVQTLYQHGSRPRLQMRNTQTAIRNSDLWQADLSAKEFASLVGDVDRARVDERPDVYLISYANADGEVGDHRLMKATLTLNRSDLHATEEILIVNEGEGVREYRFSESNFELRAPTTVAPKLFDPDPELLSSTEPGTRDSKLGTAPPPTPGTQPMTPATASADDEVEALRLIHQAGADMGEQVSVTRTAEGQLRIQGLVESDKRKNELIDALAPLKSNSAVRVEIQTVSEAAAKDSRMNQSSGTNASVETVEATSTVFPAYTDLRSRLSDEEARAFAIRMVKRSHDTMRHAWALKRLMNQFSSEELRGLNDEARAKWLTLIRSHALAFEQETKGLQQELQPIFLPSFSSSEGQSLTEILDDGSLARAIYQLFETGAANDRAIGSAFVVSTEGGGSVALRSSQFFRGLVNAESLARKIAQYHSR